MDVDLVIRVASQVSKAQKPIILRNVLVIVAKSVCRNLFSNGLSKSQQLKDKCKQGFGLVMSDIVASINLASRFNEKV